MTQGFITFATLKSFPYSMQSEIIRWHVSVQISRIANFDSNTVLSHLQGHLAYLAAKYLEVTGSYSGTLVSLSQYLTSGTGVYRFPYGRVKGHWETQSEQNWQVQAVIDAHPLASLISLLAIIVVKNCTVPMMAAGTSQLLLQCQTFS